MFWTYAGTIGTYLIVLVVPGILIGAAAGLRGWALAGLAPSLTYMAIGVTGPWLATAGLPFTVATAASSVLLLTGLAAGARLLTLRRRRRREPVAAGTDPAAPGDPAEPPTYWSGRAHTAVAACVLAATAVSIVAVLSAAGGTTAVFQRWDTVFHANGVRYIAETGDGGLYGMATVNFYPDGAFYPNAYHLVGSLVYTLTGASIPTVLNSITVPIAGIFALSLVAVVRQFGGRAVFAGSAAIVAGSATTGAYESVSSGLLPFALGLVLTPVGVVAAQRFLKRPDLDTGMVLGLTAAGLLAAHSSALFGAILFTAPMLVQRWLRREGKVGRDLLYLAAAGVVGFIVSAPHVIGAMAFKSSGGSSVQPWVTVIPVGEALKQVATFQQILDEPQMWLTVLLVTGILGIRTLGSMRWIAAAGVGFSALFVLVASYSSLPWVITISQPWWSDRYRLMALAAIPLCLLAGHGLAELQRWLAKAFSGLAWVQVRPRVPGRIGLASAVVIVCSLATVTGGFYTNANATAVAYAYHNGPETEETEPPVSAFEVAAMLEMGRLADPGERVLNDRKDGTVWLYAISGVQAVAGHYNPGSAPPDARLLANHFREYASNPEVRAAVERLGVRHVLLGSGSITPDIPRAPGLRDLDGLPFLERVFSNPDAVIYALTK
ncbi:hypothetical protein SAMN05216266_103320 [Amycolatopsis marina]|uniref:Copper-transporting ATPase n=2 Tax=Amycolatopsis marina TaxID=490629 RepID=A0A1I0XLV0_9PSEU|nr:hypothetical protein SAMN05216266_103320 [Amycolatopsis marina]